jgi:Ca2+-binding EF-hand superfamily protein
VQFDKYDLNRNNSLSAEELRAALAKNQITMTDDDVMIIKEYFLNKTRSDSITKQDFIALMNTQFDRKFDQ